MTLLVRVSDNLYMNDAEVITRHRMARASRLVDEIDQLGGPDATDQERLDLARNLTLEQWAELVGFLADHRADQLEDPNVEFVPFHVRPPGPVTVAIAIQLLEIRVANNAKAQDPFAGFPSY